MILAPWTAEQVDALNRWQRGPMVHPFTCGAGHDLVAAPTGWRCPTPGCHYVQNWAHEFMLEPPPESPF